jgi:hypothetical protein
MVKVAFIVEGKVERIMIEHINKIKWFEQFNIQIAGNIIDAKGGGNLCEKNLEKYINQVKVFEPEKIIILTDLECNHCIQEAKQRLGGCGNCQIILAKKAIEAWFLADSNVLFKLTDKKLNYFQLPENTESMPYEEYKKLLLRYTNRGTGTKVVFVKKVLKNGFKIENAAQHQNCQSAKYFIDKLQEIGAN